MCFYYVKSESSMKMQTTKLQNIINTPGKLFSRTYLIYLVRIVQHFTPETFIRQYQSKGVSERTYPEPL